MKQNLLFIMLVLVTGLTVGCQSKDEQPTSAPTPSEAASAQLDEVKTETKEAAQAVQDYAYAERAEFVDKMKSGLVEIQAELDRLSAKVDRSNGAVKADAKTKLDAVREKWVQAQKQLDQAESATESNWSDVKDGFNQSYSDLADSFSTTRQWLSDKIEP